MDKFPVSLVIITLNEGENIERCIRSVPWANEIIVLDSGSTDDTVRKAQKLGARAFVESFRGFRAQKTRAMAMAQNDWILSLDADEALSPELSEELTQILKNFDFHKPNAGQDVDGYEMPRLSYHLGRWIYHGGWYPDSQLRFFHRRRCEWTGGHVHERVTGKNILQLKNPIHHWVFKDLADQVDTNNEYSTKGALDLFEQKKKFSILKLLTKPVSKFLETYVWKKGYLDGMAGFVNSVGAAYSVFLKFSKLYELEKIKRLPLK